MRPIAFVRKSHLSSLIESKDTLSVSHSLDSLRQANLSLPQWGKGDRLRWMRCLITSEQGHLIRHGFAAPPSPTGEGLQSASDRSFCVAVLLVFGFLHIFARSRVICKDRYHRLIIRIFYHGQSRTPVPTNLCCRRFFG